MKKLICLGLVMGIFMGCLCIGTRALAADVSNSNWQLDERSWTGIMSLKTNLYNSERPLIIMLPGIGEFADVGAASRWIRNYHLYDDLDVDVLTIAFWYEYYETSAWHKMSEELTKFLLTKLDESSPFTVIIDAVSYSGYCGCYLAQMLMENGIQVKELNLADAVVPGYVTVDWIREIADEGIQVNIWAATAEGELYEAGRQALAKLEGTENVGGMVMSVWHGKILSYAIHDYGLHSEYVYAEEAAE